MTDSTDMDLNEIHVRKDVPIPKTVRGKWVDLIQKMEPGDSVLLSVGQASSMHVAARNCGVKIISRRDDPENRTNFRRVWLVKE